VKYFAAILVLILLAGCSSVNQPPFWRYHSEAEIPTVASYTMTELLYIVDETSNTVPKYYGVFYGVDNEQLPYVLIARSRRANDFDISRPYDMFDIDNSVALNLDNAKEFINVLTDCEQRWDKKHANSEATYLEYDITPEQNVAQVSEHVVHILTTLHFLCQINADGPQGVLTIGEGPARTRLYFDDKTQIARFRKLLALAVAQYREQDPGGKTKEGISS